MPGACRSRAIALTGADGTFTIKNAPDGQNIPLVGQIGKWRKEITVSTVKQCTDNPQGNIALPKSHTDGTYASVPNIAVSTGGADTLECLMTRIGLPTSEYVAGPGGTGHVHVFSGGTNGGTGLASAGSSQGKGSGPHQD